MVNLTNVKILVNVTEICNIIKFTYRMSRARVENLGQRGLFQIACHVDNNQMSIYCQYSSERK